MLASALLSEAWVWRLKRILVLLQILNAFRGPDGTPVKDLRLKDYSSGENAFPVLPVSISQKGIFHTVLS